MEQNFNKEETKRIKMSQFSKKKSQFKQETSKPTQNEEKIEETMDKLMRMSEVELKEVQNLDQSIIK